jgi:hypothetical protein
MAVIISLYRRLGRGLELRVGLSPRSLNCREPRFANGRLLERITKRLRLSDCCRGNAPFHGLSTSLVSSNDCHARGRVSRRFIMLS